MLTSERMEEIARAIEDWNYHLTGDTTDPLDCSAVEGPVSDPALVTKAAQEMGIPEIELRQFFAQTREESDEERVLDGGPTNRELSDQEASDLGC